MGKKVENLNSIFNEKMPNYQPMVLSDILNDHVIKYFKENALILTNFIRKNAKKANFRPKSTSTTSSGFTEQLFEMMEDRCGFAEEHNYLEEPKRLPALFGKCVLGEVVGFFL